MLYMVVSTPRRGVVPIQRGPGCLHPARSNSKICLSIFFASHSDLRCLRQRNGRGSAQARTHDAKGAFDTLSVSCGVNIHQVASERSNTRLRPSYGRSGNSSDQSSYRENRMNVLA